MTNQNLTHLVYLLCGLLALSTAILLLTLDHSHQRMIKMDAVIDQCETTFGRSWRGYERP